MFVVTVTLTFSWVPSSRADPCRCPSVFAAARYRSAAAVTGKGADPDTLVAAARAYISALNKLTARGERQHAQHAAG